MEARGPASVNLSNPYRVVLTLLLERLIGLLTIFGLLGTGPSLVVGRLVGHPLLISGSVLLFCKYI